MNIEEVKIDTETIQLDQFLKWAGVLGSCGETKALIAERRIKRNGETIWEKEFLSGEDNMCHSLENLEYHHFKYSQFLRPGDVHIHFFGTATLSFADGIRTQPGDRFEISQADFGAPLINRWRSCSWVRPSKSSASAFASSCWPITP